MVYIKITTTSAEAKHMIDFLKTQKYITILDTPNETTKKAIKEARTGKVKKAKNSDALFRQILK